MCKYSENRYMCIIRELVRGEGGVIISDENGGEAIDLDTCVSDDVTLYKCDECYALSMEPRRGQSFKMRIYNRY